MMNDGRLHVRLASSAVVPLKGVSSKDLDAAEVSCRELRGVFLDAMWDEGHAGMEEEKCWQRYQDACAEFEAAKNCIDDQNSAEAVQCAKRAVRDAQKASLAAQAVYRVSQARLRGVEDAYNHASNRLARLSLRKVNDRTS